MTAGGRALAPGDLRLAARLLPGWGIPADAALARADRGTNNRTFIVRQGRQRFVLRVSPGSPVAQVRAEHRILRRLRRAALPLRVPEPYAALDGSTVRETAEGPATLCRWIPGVHPVLEGGPALERFGRAAALLADALLDVPLRDTLVDWRTDPLTVRGAVTDVSGLCRGLRAAGVSAAHTAALEAAAAQVSEDWPRCTGALRAQVIHGDLGAGNVLAGAPAGRVTGLLDFELAGAGFRVQDPLAALYNSRALEAADWPGRTAAFLRGYASAGRRLEPAEAAAVPGLLIARALGSALWRSAQWRDGQVPLSEVTGRLSRLEATARWVAANAARLESLAAGGR